MEEAAEVIPRKCSKFGDEKRCFSAASRLRFWECTWPKGNLAQLQEMIVLGSALASGCPGSPGWGRVQAACKDSQCRMQCDEGEGGNWLEGCRQRRANVHTAVCSLPELLKLPASLKTRRQPFPGGLRSRGEPAGLSTEDAFPPLVRRTLEAFPSLLTK